MKEVKLYRTLLVVFFDIILNMNKIKLGVLAGLIYALLDILPMFYLPFPDKTSAITGAFINRFAIGFLIPTTSLHMPYWLQGIILGLVLSLPDAIITKSYAPIIGTGVLGGLLIGIISQKLVSKK